MPEDSRCREKWGYLRRTKGSCVGSEACCYPSSDEEQVDEEDTYERGEKKLHGCAV